ncbi:PQQ-binding-like beta-propeller repeat protein [bacterium]|nr:PQQ-binding-like beta-propeller repeat protein [bacterium]
MTQSLRHPFERPQGNSPSALRTVCIGAVFWLLAVAADASAQPVGPPDDQAGPLTPQQKAALNHVLFRSPQMTAFIVQAREAINRGDLQNGLRMLQQVLGDPRGAVDPAAGAMPPPDSFAWTEAGLKSHRREVLDIFESLTTEQLQFYERTYGPIAAETLARAEASGDLTQLQEVVRRCWPTAAGARAVDLLATRLLDQGQLESAARLWSELADSRMHRHRVTEVIFEKAAVAQVLAGNSDDAERMLQQLELRFGTRPVSLAALERELIPSLPRFDGEPADWGSPYGGPNHNAISAGTTPWLEAEWSTPLSSASPFDMLSNWEKKQIANEVDEIGTAVAPIVVNGQIVVRDLDGVRACDPATGRTMWRYDGTLTFPQLVTRILQTRYRTSPDSIMEQFWIGNPTIGMVTSDGERVFAIDWVDFSAVAPATQLRSRRFSGPTILATNRLVCLPASRPDSANGASSGETVRVEPLWTLGGTPDPSPSDRLGGHLFVGPPLALGDSVFAIVESFRDKELKLIRVDARSGQLQWMQTLGIIEQPMYAASQPVRRMPSCIPAIARGIAVCPTDAGFLVGVDTVSGELLWMQTYFEMRLPSRFGSTILREAEEAFIGFPDPPHIERDRVVYLPRHSDDLHCYDLRSGNELWHVPRETDQYVAAIRDDVVAVVGSSGMRGVSLIDGHTLWQRRVGVPSGRGVQTEDGYLLPLKSGSVTQFDLKTGSPRGSSIVPTLLQRQLTRTQIADAARPLRPQEIARARFGLLDESISSELRPGNLLLHDRSVYSVGFETMTAFPQAGSLLLELHSRRGTTEAVDLFQLACVELLLGNQTEGEATLVELAERSGHQQQNEARWMLRNLILSDLRRSDGRLSAAQFQRRVQQFESLIDSPFDEQQLLFERIRWEQKHGNQNSLLRVVAELPTLRLRSFIPQADGFDSVVSSSALSRSLIRETLLSSDSPASNPLRDVMNRELLAALRSDSVEELQRFIELYGDTPYAARVRNRLADHLMQRGDAQAAELTLLPNLQSAEEEQRAVSRILHIALLTQERLDSEAGRALLDYSQQSHGVSIKAVLTDGLQSPLSVLASGARLDAKAEPKFEDFVAAFDRGLQAWSAYLDMQPLARDVRQVVIRRQSRSMGDQDLVRLWSETPRQIAGPEGIEFSILHRGSYINDQWRLVDRYAGTERGTIRIASRPNFANAESYRSVGHFMPIGGQASLLGVSLLEYQNQSPLWQFAFPPLESSLESLEPGPSTPTVCVFQSRKHLIAVDPRQGDVLWRRSDLDLESGVYVDREEGLIGDDRVIVIFHRDQQSYTRFDALTGAVLNQGKLPLDFRFDKRLFGRKLFYISTTDTNSQRFVRVWDPLTETYELDEPFAVRLLHDATTDGELALLETDGRLRVYQMPKTQLILDTQLGQSALHTVTTLQFFSDRERFYVNLQRPRTRPSPRQDRHFPVTDSLPAQALEPGLLIAVNRRNGRVQWRREVTHKSLLRLERCHLPFFVGMSRVQVSNRQGTSQTLDLEVIDRRTGETLGQQHDLLSDRFVHYRLDRDHGILELHGLASRVDLDFRVPPRGILLEQQPL